MFKRSIGVLVVCTYAILPACAMPNPMPSTTHDLPIVVTTGNELTPEQQQSINAALKELSIELEKAEKEYAARNAVVAEAVAVKKPKRHPFRAVVRYSEKLITLPICVGFSAGVGYLIGQGVAVISPWIGGLSGLAGWSDHWTTSDLELKQKDAAEASR